MSCPGCRQRTGAGLCEHCHFDTTDEIAAAALAARRANRPTSELPAGTRQPCPEGGLPALLAASGGVDEACLWCGHDPGDAEQAAALAAVRRGAWERRRRLARDRTTRLAERTVTDAPAFMTCLHCSQWGRSGMCEWCDFDNDDTSLRWATDASEGHPWLLFGLPLAGFAVGVSSIGVHHTAVPLLSPAELTPLLVAKVVVASLVFGVTALVFTELTHGRRRFATPTTRPPGRG